MLHMPIECESNLEVPFENKGGDLKETPSAGFVAKVGRAASLAGLTSHGT